METSKEGKVGLLHQILPPRLEDAGLEDCALPPDSIKEAFLKAAMAVKSRAASIFTASDDEETEGECVQDPWPTAKDASDALVGASTEHDDPGPCAAEKGSGVPEVGGEDVVVGGEANAKERGDEVVVVGVDVSEGGRTCVQGLQGLEIGEEAKNGGGDDDEKEVTCKQLRVRMKQLEAAFESNIEAMNYRISSTGKKREIVHQT